MILLRRRKKPIGISETTKRTNKQMWNDRLKTNHKLVSRNKGLSWTCRDFSFNLQRKYGTKIPLKDDSELRGVGFRGWNNLPATWLDVI